MAQDPERVEGRRNEEEGERTSDREALGGHLAARGGENARRDHEWNEQQHLVVRPAVDRACTGERQPHREPRVAPGDEARGEHKARADDGDRERAAGCPQDLTECGEKDRRTAGAARRDVGDPCREPLGEREPGRDHERSSEHDRERDEAAVARIDEGGDRESQRGPDKKLRLREQRERGEPCAARVTRADGEHDRGDG